MAESCVISGAGVSGLLLALALKKIGLNVAVYEQAPEFTEGVGGAIGLYPNGLRVIRDISPDLLSAIRAQGRPYVKRKWMRHDGTEVAVGEEKFLCEWKSEKDQVELASMGIRRWRLQKALCDACALAEIPIFTGKRINSSSILPDGQVLCQIHDGSSVRCSLLFGCDGVKSAVRASFFGNEQEPKYTGITCLMGSAPIAESSAINGICFPSSSTTNCHACFYPANEKEIIFQFFFPTEERPETWRPLTADESKKECADLQALLIKDGWHSMFTDALTSANSVLRVGLRARKPIPVWHAASPDGIPKVFLLGDGAHPPVPYIGQGAMMAIEDVGILSELIRRLCKPSPQAKFERSQLKRVALLYEKIRIPRTTAMLAASQALGDMQLARGSAGSWFQGWMKEMDIWINVKRFGTLPTMFFGSRFDYLAEVDQLLEETPKAKL
ncbi:hypothetical protein HDU91_006004 [Kappamyces sp. JEL0680]|nr:hypothetical protein HDU91_006004 [Kappamyces sp. JEL0680]